MTTHAEHGYTTAQAATVLNIGRPTLFKLLTSGALASTKTGNRRIITPEAIHEYRQKKHAHILRWEDPPQSGAPGADQAERRSTSRWDLIAAALLDEPGRWAVVYEGDFVNSSSLNSIIKQGRVRCFAPAGSFESVVRKSGSKTVVHARYVGDRHTATYGCEDR